MATLIEAWENGHDHDTNSVDFTLEHLNIPVNIGIASRNWEIKKFEHAVRRLFDTHRL